MDYCKLPKNAKLYFGSGGSDCIVAITDKYAYKYFPLLVTNSNS